MQKYIIFSILGSVFITSSCISIGVHERRLRELQKVQGERDQYKKELSYYKLRKEELEMEVEQGVETKKELEQKIAEKDEKISDIRKTYDELITELKEDISGGLVGVEQSQYGLKISMGNKVLFASGRARLQPKGKKILASVAGILKKTEGYFFRVAGHSDNIPIRGKLKNIFPTNWELSAMRSSSVLRFMITKGADPKNLILAAYADNRPIAKNDTAKGRRQNRRVEIFLVRKDRYE